ncbi:hypothetical protein QQX98_002609 [Neonectria punicea]|uniref:Uncharacterized protein n=1 Tax=Neonectria punicea TaxID=979145 RepID=A0ABR1HI08_9HYPO
MSPYASAHASPQGPGDARPTAIQIIKDEAAEGKLVGKVIVITGVSSGLGVETARALSLTGATLFLTARDLAKARSALAGFFDSSRMHLIKIDQSSLDSVRAAASEILAKTDKINILINNAGVMAVQNLEFTKDGHELQFGTNHLSHFLFFELLKPALLAGVTPELNSRVVNVSSSGHMISGINASDNYNFQQGGYSPWVAYGQSKTANIYMANEIERRYGSKGLHATSLHPGGIMTPLARHLPADVVESMVANEEMGKRMKSAEQGAATTVWAAVSKQWEHTGGKYLDNYAETKLSKNETRQFATGHAKHAYDAEKAGRLWEDSLKLVGLA